MIKSLRAYRYFRAVLAVLLLFSISLPMVRYACAMTGMTMMMATNSSSMCMVHEAAMAESAMRGMPASDLCAEDHASSMAEWCNHETSATEAVACCKVETARSEKAPFMEFKLVPSQTILPLVSVLSDSPIAVSSRFFFLSQETSRARGGGVPLRVLHASFLI